LADEDGIVVNHQMLRCCMLAEHLWSRGKEEGLPNEGSARSTLASYCNWMG